MKNLKISYVVLVLIFTVISGLTGCKKDPKPGEGLKGGLDGTRLWGEITENITLTSDNTYVLDGGVNIKSGATLSIEPGVTVKAMTSKISYLIIEQGAKINAQGAATSPIVFTSDSENPDAGDWGGIMICGYARTNVVGGSSVTEIGNAAYGGNNDSDNSGIIRYVRLEYAGVAFDEEHESNGFAFYSVGNQTTVEYLESYRCSDDGFEFFGGTVNAKYLVSVMSKDDSFDWTEGWNGKGQFWLAKQGSNEGDRGFEADNNSNNNSASPYSNPVIANITLIGMNHENSQGMKLREGTKGKFYNVILSGFAKRGIEVEHNQTLVNLIDGQLVVDYIGIDTTASYISGTGYSLFKYTNSKDASGSNIELPEGYVLSSVKKIESSANIHISSINLNNCIGSLPNGRNMNAVDPWFDNADYIGACDISNNWWANWTRGLDE